MASNEELEDQKATPALNRGRTTEDERLLSREGMPRAPLVYDFTHSDPWRVFRIMGEFVEGFETLASVSPAVSFFGSARIGPDDPMYTAAEQTARRLAEYGFSVMTGGGPGIMEAANKGAAEIGGRSVGCNIELPFEQGMNEYAETGINFRYFFVRKVMFVKYAEAFIIFPGGFGTMDELFESLTLIQTGKVRNFPVVLFGTAYWSGLLDWMRNFMLDEAKISSEDLDLLVVTDDTDEAVQTVIDCYEEQAGSPIDSEGERMRRGEPPGGGRGGMRPPVPKAPRPAPGAANRGQSDGS